MKKGNVIMVSALACLLLFALLAPQALAAFEDYSLLEKTESFEMEEINLTPDESFFLKELRDVSEFFFGSRTYVYEGEKLSRSEVTAIGQEVIGLLIGEDEVTLSDKNMEIFMTPSSDLQSLYVVWECYFTDADKNKYFLLIDDQTKKMIAFAAPAWKLDAYMKGGTSAVSEIIGKYYGFDNLEFFEMDEMKKEEYSSVVTIDADGNEILLPVIRRNNVIYYNVYPDVLLKYYDAESAG